MSMYVYYCRTYENERELRTGVVSTPRISIGPAGSCINRDYACGDEVVTTVLFEHVVNVGELTSAG